MLILTDEERAELARVNAVRDAKTTLRLDHQDLRAHQFVDLGDGQTRKVIMVQREHGRLARVGLMVFRQSAGAWQSVPGSGDQYSAAAWGALGLTLDGGTWRKP